MSDTENETTLAPHVHSNEGDTKQHEKMEPDNAGSYEPLTSSEHAPTHRRAGFFDTLCPRLSAKVRSFASTKQGFWIMILLSPLFFVLAFVALVYVTVFVSGPMMVAQAIWYVPELNEIRDEYERNGIPVRARVTKHCRTKEKNQYNVTAVYEAPQDSRAYAKTFKYTVEGQSGLGISIGRVRLGFSEGPAFPQEMDFLVLPDHPASGQLREHAIQKQSDFQRALMILFGPIVYFLFAYYLPKQQLSEVTSCGFCHDATVINLVSVILLGLNLLLAKTILPAFHAQNVKELYEGACLAGLEDMDVERQPDSSINMSVNGSGRGMRVTTTENGRKQAFGLSIT